MRYDTWDALPLPDLKAHERRHSTSESSNLATTGIAANSMEVGMTAHRSFSLPLSLDQTSSSYCRGTVRCKKQKSFKRRPLFRLMRSLWWITGCELSIMIFGPSCCNLPFGCKIIVGGDFRQLLPVVPGASRAEILANCVTASPLWRLFERITLEDNMRAQGDAAFIRWLLQVGIILGVFHLLPEWELQTWLRSLRICCFKFRNHSHFHVELGFLQQILPESLQHLTSTVFGNNIATWRPLSCQQVRSLRRPSKKSPR